QRLEATPRQACHRLTVAFDDAAGDARVGVHPEHRDERLAVRLSAVAGAGQSPPPTEGVDGVLVLDKIATDVGDLHCSASVQKNSCVLHAKCKKAAGVPSSGLGVGGENGRAGPPLSGYAVSAFLLT